MLLHPMLPCHNCPAMQKEHPQDGATANGMPAVAAAPVERQPTLPSTAAAELETGLAAENERLRSELSEVRSTIAEARCIWGCALTLNECAYATSALHMCC